MRELAAQQSLFELVSLNQVSEELGREVGSCSASQHVAVLSTRRNDF